MNVFVTTTELTFVARLAKSNCFSPNLRSLPSSFLGDWGGNDVGGVGSSAVGRAAVVVDTHGHVAGNGEVALEAREVPGRRCQGRGHPIADGSGRGPTGQAVWGVAVWEGKPGHVRGNGLGRGEHGLRGVGATGGVVVASSIASHGGSCSSSVGLLELLQALLAVLAAETDTPSPFLLAIAGTTILEPNLGNWKTKGSTVIRCQTSSG